MPDRPQDPIFGDIISVWTVEDGIADGALIDITPTAKEAGFKYRTVITRAAFYDFVKVPEGCEGLQDEAGRLWDVLWMAMCAVRGSIPKKVLAPNEFTYQLHVVQKRSDLGKTPPLATLKWGCGPAAPNDPTPVITISQENED